MGLPHTTFEIKETCVGCISQDSSYFSPSCHGSSV